MAMPQGVGTPPPPPPPPSTSSATTTTTAPRYNLYVGNLSPRVTEVMLRDIFASEGHVSSCKIIPDRTFQHGGLNFGFVDFADLASAENALAKLNGRKIFDAEIKVNWAYQAGGGGPAASGGSSSLASPAPLPQKEDMSAYSHIFVGDLSQEVTEETLEKAFARFGAVTDTRILMDMITGKSRGYGFVAFKEKADAEKAITTMNGEWLGSKAIRVNWANQKTGGSAPRATGPFQQGMGFGNGGMMYDKNVAVNASYESILHSAAPFNTTVYVGNLAPGTTKEDILPSFQGFGYTSEVRMQAERGFGFVKMDSHENAAMAISHLNGTVVKGRAIRCSWGKDRMTDGLYAAGVGALPAVMAGPPNAPGPAGALNSPSPVYFQPAAYPAGFNGYAGYPYYSPFYAQQYFAAQHHHHQQQQQQQAQGHRRIVGSPQPHAGR